MKLVLYSGGDAELNHELDIELLNLIEPKRPLFTFIPYSGDDADEDFQDFVDQFSAYGIKDFDLFALDQPFTDYRVNQVFSKSDLIYLSGGNTYYFLQSIRRSGLLNKFREYASSGNGVLAGMSAGSIIMGPNINTAGFPDFDRDENEVGLKNQTGLKLYNFEFFPHYCNTRRYIHSLNIESRLLRHPLIACEDGAGVVITDTSTMFIGNIWQFFRGKKFKLK